MHGAGGSDKDAGQDAGSGQVGDGAGEAEDKLGGSLGRAFLAFRVGVGKESADGEQEDGAQAETEPGGDNEAGRLADQNRRNQHQEEAQAATDAFLFRSAERQADQRQQGEEGVDAQLDSHPTAQRN